jgi:hypothetical protein
MTIPTRPFHNESEDFATDSATSLFDLRPCLPLPTITFVAGEREAKTKANFYSSRYYEGSMLVSGAVEEIIHYSITIV